MSCPSDFRSQLLMLMLIAFAVLLALAANTAITAWIVDRYPANIVQANFVYLLLVFLAVLLVAFLFGRWVVRSQNM